MFKYELWDSVNSIPTLFEAGCPPDKLKHHAVFVELLQLVLSREKPTIKTIDKMDELAEEFNRGQEELYVQYDIDNVGLFPLCFHQTSHLGPSTKMIGDLKHSSQAPLERRVGLQKHDSRSFRSPYLSFITKVRQLPTSNYSNFSLKYPDRKSVV